jgi:hypothetical protein
MGNQRFLVRYKYAKRLCKNANEISLIELIVHASTIQATILASVDEAARGARSYSTSLELQALEYLA